MRKQIYLWRVIIILDYFRPVWLNYIQAEYFIVFKYSLNLSKVYYVETHLQSSMAWSCFLSSIASAIHSFMLTQKEIASYWSWIQPPSISMS